MKKVIISSVVALAFSLALTVTVSASSYTFANYLTVGSSGADVSALQSFLVANNFLTMPAGVSMGYFGQLTKAAVIAYQTSVGIVPQSGFVGPLTIAKLNNAGPVTMTPPATFTCPVGWSCQGPANTTTTTTTTTGTVGTITTPGVEGILSVTAGPLSNSVLTMGALKAPILDIRLQAQDSDIAIQRVAVDLGTSTNLFNYVYSNIYLIDPTTGNVIAHSPLNSSTVVQSGSNYVVNLTGFNFVVPKDVYKDLQVAVDIASAIPSSVTTVNTVGIDGNGIRGVDGANIVQYGPSSSGLNVIAQTISLNDSLGLSSQAIISLDGSTAQVNTIPVTDTTNGNYLGLPVLTFDVLAQNDTLHIHNLQVVFSPASAHVTAAYLYQGSTLITSAAVNASNGTANFLNLPDMGTGSAIIPINTSMAYTIKADVTGLINGTNSIALTASIPNTAPNSTFYNSTDGTGQAAIGSALGNQITVAGKGPALALNGAPSPSVVTTFTGNQDQSSNQASATSTISTSFNVNVTAVGTPIFFNGEGTSSPVFTFNVYDLNGTILGQGIASTSYIVGPSSLSPSAGLTVPTGSSIISLGNGAYEIPQGATVTLNPTFTFGGKYGNGAHIATPVTVGVASFNYETSQGGTVVPVTYMSTLTQWRTAGLSAN